MWKGKCCELHPRDILFRTWPTQARTLGTSKGRHLESSIAHDLAEVWLRRLYYRADTGEKTAHEKGSHLESSIAHDLAEVWLQRAYHRADTGEKTAHEKGRHVESSILHDLAKVWLRRVYYRADTGIPTAVLSWLVLLLTCSARSPQ